MDCPQMLLASRRCRAPVARAMIAVEPAADRAGQQTDQPEDIADRAHRSGGRRHLRSSGGDLRCVHRRRNADDVVRQVRVVDPHQHVQHMLGQHGPGEQQQQAEELTIGLVVARQRQRWKRRHIRCQRRFRRQRRHSWAADDTREVAWLPILREVAREVTPGQSVLAPPRIGFWQSDFRPFKKSIAAQRIRGGQYALPGVTELRALYFAGPVVGLVVGTFARLNAIEFVDWFTIIRKFRRNFRPAVARTSSLAVRPSVARRTTRGRR